MSILGPLVAATTSTVTVALASAALSLVTEAPSTSRRTGSSTVEPGSACSRSISRTSPTATFSWRPPARTIAYTIDDFTLCTHVWGPVTPGTGAWARRRAVARRTGGRSSLRTADRPGQTGLSGRSRAGSQRRHRSAGHPAPPGARAAGGTGAGLGLRGGLDRRGGL